jgi:large subunit ribosomal protein L22
LEKALHSAVANFMNTEDAPKISPEELYIKELRIDGGYTLKRFKAGAMGRAMPRKKRTCHITIVVTDELEN